MNYEKLSRENLERHERGLGRLAKDIQRVLRIAYTRVFEHEQTLHRLPEGIIRRELFDEDLEERIEAQKERIRRSCCRDGSIYMLCFDGGEVVGVAKTSPARSEWSQRFRLRAPDRYLNDIAVSIPRRGIGSHLIKTALVDCSESGRAVLDAFEGNNVTNEWFARLGFSPMERQPADLNYAIGTFVIPRIRMSAPRHDSVSRPTEATRFYPE